MTWALDLGDITDTSSVSMETAINIDCTKTLDVEWVFWTNDDIYESPGCVDEGDILIASSRSWVSDASKFRFRFISRLYLYVGYILQPNTRYKVNVKWDGVDTAELYIDDVLCDTGTLDAASVPATSASRNFTLSNGLLEYFKWTVDDTLQIHYDATLDDHNSTVLTDLAGSNNADFQNMTTANWLDLGGDEPTEGNVSDIAFDIPSPEFSIDATVIAPSVSSDVSFSIPIPEFSITVETTAPSVSSDVTLDMPAPEFSIEASVTSPNVVSNISFDVPSPEFNISVSVGNDSVSNIEFDIPAPEFAVNATVTAPNVNSDVSFNVPAPEFDISVSVGSPSNHSAIEFDVPGPEFSISASITVPTVNSTIEFTIPAPEFRGEESVIIVDDRAIVTYIAKSSVVEYNAETSVIKYNTPTNIVKLR